MMLSKEKYKYKLFNKKISCYIEDGVTNEYINKCINHLNSMREEILNKFLDATIRYCEDCKDEIYKYDIDIPVNVSRKEILKFINPNSIRIESSKNDKIGYAISFDCDWQKKEGLEFIIVEDEIKYLGKYQGKSIWQEKFDTYKNYIYANYNQSISNLNNNSKPRILPLMIIFFGYLIGLLGIVILCLSGNFIMSIILILIMTILYIYILYKLFNKIKITFH